MPEHMNDCGRITKAIKKGNKMSRRTFCLTVTFVVTLALIMLGTNYAFVKRPDQALLPKSTLSSEMPDYNSPVRYDFSEGQTLTYKVEFTQPFKDDEGKSSIALRGEGIQQMTVIDADPDNGYVINLELSLISAEAPALKEDLGFEPEKAQQIKAELHLKPNGALEFDKDKLGNDIKQQGKLLSFYGKVFSAIACIFPPLPQSWSGEAISDGDYTYNILGPVLIKGERTVNTTPPPIREETNALHSGLHFERKSLFSDGRIKSGQLKHFRYTEGKPKLIMDLRVSLVSEGQK
jgi:hypothetical protein